MNKLKHFIYYLICLFAFDLTSPHLMVSTASIAICSHLSESIYIWQASILRYSTIWNSTSMRYTKFQGDIQSSPIGTSLSTGYDFLNHCI